MGNSRILAAGAKFKSWQAVFVIFFFRLLCILELHWWRFVVAVCVLVVIRGVMSSRGFHLRVPAFRPPHTFSSSRSCRPTAALPAAELSARSAGPLSWVFTASFMTSVHRHYCLPVSFWESRLLLLSGSLRSRVLPALWVSRPLLTSQQRLQLNSVLLLPVSPGAPWPAFR